MNGHVFRGINTSSALDLLNMVDIDRFDSMAAPFFHGLKQHRINTPFLSTTFTRQGRVTISCCFTPNDGSVVRRLIRGNEALRERSSFTDNVGLLTVYPHRSSLSIAGYCYAALEDRKLTVLGMCSSISSLVFVLRYPHLEQAVRVMKTMVPASLT